MTGRWFFLMGLGFLGLAFPGCGDKSAAPTTVVVTPGTLAGRDWNFATLSASFPTKEDPNLLVFNNKLWLLDGFNTVTGGTNEVWSSSNGKSWTQVLTNHPSPGSSQFTPRYEASAFVFNGEMWLAGGFYSAALNDVWASSDGSSWTQKLADTASPGAHQFPRRTGAASAAFNGKLWIFGGYDGVNTLNDIWSSSDGVSWTLEAADTASPGSNQFTRRWGAACLDYNGQLWLMGGDNGSNDLNDLWVSSDGATWTQYLTDHSSPGPTQFPRRAFATAFLYGGAVWLIGGEGGGTRLNDVWYSTDAFNWTEETSGAAFPARSHQAGAVFNNTMWLIGGVNPNGNILNDIWYSPF